ncbi:MAG TPA: hypothetical protein ENI06_12220 [Spirochaetales bacterium]|nr:hypothetical protein [Spirochaetales bacterium]
MAYRKAVKKRSIYIFALFFLFFYLSPLSIFSEQIKEMQFINQPITDILLALGEISGKSIIPDETVKGSASYYFSETDFETAIKVFLNTYKMYLRKENNIYYVSRIKVEYDERTGKISMDGEDVEINLLVRAASKAIGKTILFDSLPSQNLSVHITKVEPQKLLDIIIKRYPDYKVEADQDYFYIKHIPPRHEGKAPEGRRAQTDMIHKAGELYSMDVDKARFREIIDDLFIKSDHEYSLLLQRDSYIEKLRFKDKSFEKLLRLILDQANADYSKVGEIYYIFEIQQRDILKKLKTTIRLPLIHIAAQGISNLFPSEMLSSKFFKLDVNSNSIILSGSLEEIGPVQEFIKKIDLPDEGQKHYRFDLKYLDNTNVRSMFPPAFKYIEPIIIPNTNSFIIRLFPERKKILEEYLKLIDRPEETVTVKLKYIKAQDLLEKLPPSITEKEIIETSDSSVVFLKTSPEKLERFYRELELLDQPAPQIRYQVLVIQHQAGEAINWSDSFKATAGGTENAFIGTIGSLLSLSFDIVSTFGYQFGVQLSLDLSTNKARVLADTTLIGVSDQEISFQNTETYRYREIEVDEDGNTKYTGVTREITSGLIFNIKGWVSGNGMITMDVKATVSKRGTDVSTESGSIPPTSENVINTKIRTLSGKPLVIGGLIRQERSIHVNKVPILGSIPLLGYLFQSRKESVENSELVIYIVPHVDYSKLEETEIGLRLEKLYNKFLGS